MVITQFHCLVSLAREKHYGRTAEACHVSQADLMYLIAAAEKEFGNPIVKPGSRFRGFTPDGERVLATMRKFLDDYGDLCGDELPPQAEGVLAPLLQRRSVSPKRLCGPGPNAEETDLILQAALRAPDHGGLHPWRVLEFPDRQREALADLFEQEKRRRDPLASPSDLRLAREHAIRPPALMAFIVAPRARSKVPVREQWLAAGAALGNLLNAVHQLGFGAIMLSGERCFDAALAAQLGVKADEFLAGFISLGSVIEAPPTKRHALPAQVWSSWLPDAAATNAADPQDTESTGIDRSAEAAQDEARRAGRS